MQRMAVLDRTYSIKNNNIYFLFSSINSNAVPPKLYSYDHALPRKFTKTIIFKADTVATGNYIWDKYAIILKNLQPTTYNNCIQILPPRKIHYPTNILQTCTSLSVTTSRKSSSLVSESQEIHPPLNRTTVWFWLLNTFFKTGCHLFQFI